MTRGLGGQTQAFTRYMRHRARTVTVTSAGIRLVTADLSRVSLLLAADLTAGGVRLWTSNPASGEGIPMSLSGANPLRLTWDADGMLCGLPWWGQADGADVDVSVIELQWRPPTSP